MTRDEVIAAIRKYTARLGRVPTVKKLVNSTKVTRRAIRKNFGTYMEALNACGLERRGCGYKITLENLFLDWAGVVRKLGKIPSVAQYELHARHSSRPLTKLYGGWPHVPAGLLEYAKKAGLQAQWKDVLDLAAGPHPAQGKRGVASSAGNTPYRHRILPDTPIYGPPLVPSPLIYAPTNEAGVILLFGAVAREKGFAVTHVQKGFPDCEAIREIEPERWQPVRIEFEYESRNFLAHMHPVGGCDLIVCWRHNWPECPLEVLELKSAIKQTLPKEQQ